MTHRPGRFGGCYGLARQEGVSDPAGPGQEINENGGLLPGPGAILGGPTFPEWLDAQT